MNKNKAIDLKLEILHVVEILEDDAIPEHRSCERGIEMLSKIIEKINTTPDTVGYHNLLDIAKELQTSLRKQDHCLRDEMIGIKERIEIQAEYAKDQPTGLDLLEKKIRENDPKDIEFLNPEVKQAKVDTIEWVLEKINEIRGVEE